MEVVRFENSMQFEEKVEGFLLERESEHNLILGLLEAINGNKLIPSAPLYLSLETNGEVKGVILRTDEKTPLIFSHMDLNCLDPLTEFFVKETVKFQKIVGEADVVSKFANDWGGDLQMKMSQGLYQLDSVVPPDYEGGKLLLATEENNALLQAYCLGFVRDCFPDLIDREEESKKQAQRLIEGKNAFFWVNRQGELVTLVANTRESRNGATLSWVYTPEEFRRKGYASKAVAALSQRLLDNGKKFCNLYTDLLNPTSNSIYQKVGYKKIAESREYAFERS